MSIIIDLCRILLYNSIGDTMARELKKHQLVERSVIKKFRKSIWNNFIECVKGYSLISPDDIIGIKLNYSAEAVLSAKLMQQLKRVSEFDFELKIIADDDVLLLANELNIPLSDNLNGCAKSVNFICLDDVIEKVLHSMMFEHQLKSIPPIQHTNGADIISPLYCIQRDAIYAFSRYNDLGFEYHSPDDEKANFVLELVNNLKNKNEGIDSSIFKAVHAVCLDTMPGYETNSEYHFFLDEY